MTKASPYPPSEAAIHHACEKPLDIFGSGLWFESLAQAARNNEPFVEIAREIEGNWVEILKQRLALDRNSALGLIASTEGLAVIEAVLGRTASDKATFTNY